MQEYYFMIIGTIFTAEEALHTGVPLIIMVTDTVSCPPD